METVPELLVVRLGDHPAPGVELVRRHVGDLDEHGRDEVDALQHLQVDVHVERHLTLLLDLLLLLRPLVVALKQRQVGLESLGRMTEEGNGILPNFQVRV